MSSLDSHDHGDQIYGPGVRQIAEIIPGFLYLSDIKSASDEATLVRAGITHVISILSAPIPWLGPPPSYSCRILHVSLDDHDGENVMQHFETTNAFINEAFRENKTFPGSKNKVLCHCLAGISRSPTIVVAYLMWACGLGKDEALSFVRQQRCVADPNPGFVRQLGAYEAAIQRSSSSMGIQLVPWKQKSLILQ